MAVRATAYKPMCALVEVLITNFETVVSKVVKLEAEVGVNV